MKRGKCFDSCEYKKGDGNDLKRVRAQVSVFIIIAIVLVAGVVLFFVFREKIFVPEIPSELEPVYSYYESCVQEATRQGVEILGSQAGYIEMPEFVSGSDYAPTSSELEFMGFGVPYWYYITGNGLIKEQVPTRAGIEAELEGYIEGKVAECRFDDFYVQGFLIDVEKPEADVRIRADKVEVSVDSKLAVKRSDVSASKSVHKVEVPSRFGKFYETARDIYDKEKEESFLENYAVDVLYSYAPVEGVEITCAPKIWKSREVAEELQEGFENNIASIKLGGNDYFSVEMNVDENVNFVNSKNWAYKIEIAGAEDELMIAEPVGNEAGLGVMGFCYAPYHFVYDVSFPVLIQIYNNEEIFQFPVVVVIDDNMPREGIGTEIEEQEDFDLCKYKIQDVEVSVYDTNLNSVDADVSYVCFSQKCRLGETEAGKFSGKAPSCVNGYLSVRAEGYKDKRQLFSSNSETRADVILDKEHEVEVELRLGGKSFDVDDGNAVISFVGDDSESAVLPEMNKMTLSEGNYDISVYVYGDSSITIPASTKTQCQEIPREGLLGLFGSTKEQCFDIGIPATKIESALVGGGNGEVYVLESELEKGKMIVDVGKLKKPSSIEELHENYAVFDTMGVYVEFENE